MKRLVAGLLVAAALGACSVDSIGSEPRETVPATPVVSTVAAFRADLETQGITFGGTDEALEGLANDFVCGGLTRFGISTETLAAMVSVVMDENASLTGEQAGYFIGASVGYYCPEYGDAVLAVVNQSSSSYTTA